MSEFLFQYGLFFAKTVTWVAAIVIVAVVLANVIHHLRAHAADHLEVKNLNHRFRDLADSLKHALLSPEEWKHEVKAHKAEDKARARAHKAGAPVRWTDVIVDEASEAVRMRREMEVAFRDEAAMQRPAAE